MNALQIIWYVLIAGMLVVYTILDGFDLGVGIWYLAARTLAMRKAMFGAIGPVWDGNEVWLILTGAALFAAFPFVYATVFSGMYLALMLVLAALIIRAVSIEFWSHADTDAGRTGWGLGFSLGSLLPSLLYGVALGNLLAGLPLTVDGNYTGGLLGLLRWYPLLVGVVNLVLLAGHGALYLAMKTENDLAQQARAWARPAVTLSLLLIVGLFIISPIAVPHLLGNYLRQPLLWVFPALTLAALGLALRASGRCQYHRAFRASASAITLLLLSMVGGLFPTMVVSTGPGRSLTLLDSSTPSTLLVMLIITAVGLPIVGAYVAWVYRFFGGKVSPEGKNY